MKRWLGPFVIVVLLSLLAAFSRSTDAGPDLTAELPFMSRAEVRHQGAVTVRAAVLRHTAPAPSTSAGTPRSTNQRTASP